MNSVTSFRVLLLTLAATVLCYGIVSGAAEVVAVARPDFPKDMSQVALPAAKAAPIGWLGAVAPLRSDLESNQILALALQEMQHTGEDRSAAGPLIRNALASKPYDAELWLARSILESRQDPNGPGAAESLKMAYLTAPAEAGLMPLRLDVATRSDVLADPELREFARSDVRLMLTRQPNQRDVVTSIYRRASTRGKKFLEETVQSVAPRS